MPSTPLKNQIIEWLKKKPYWFQYAGNQLLEGDEIDSTLIDTAYKHFLEDENLITLENAREPIAFNEVAVGDTALGNNLHLVCIKDIENVNALAKGQEIKINKQLTVVYGNNGTGKSGYVRLLNNAFNSRGDKRILKNVYNKEASGIPACKFIFQSTEQPYEKHFPTEKGSFEFSQYSVFDTQSIKVHLDGDNQLNFIPSGFEMFEKVLQLLDAIKTKLNSDIAAHKPPNNFQIHFEHENEIKLKIASLGASTNEDALKKLGLFSVDDTNSLDEITEKIESLRSLNIQAKIADLEKLQGELGTVVQRLQAILNCLTQDKIDYYIGLIDAFHKFQELSKAGGIKSLEQYNIELIGSNEWREFIVAAKKYSTAIDVSKLEDSQHAADRPHCPLCLQSLTERETNLINLYWQFLSSAAEQELNRTVQKIKDLIKELKGLNPVKLDETTSLFSHLKSFFPGIAEEWKEIALNSEISRQNMIQNLSNLNKELPVSPLTKSTTDFNVVALAIRKAIDDLILKKPDQEITSLTLQRNYLTDKSLLQKLLPQILEFISTHKWAALAEGALTSLKTNAITTFQGSLFTEHITDKYKMVFSEECDKLDAPKVVEIDQQNAKVRTLRKFNVAKQTVSQVLSEGEQRAISFADFITEVRLNPNNRGVIFDDPVTSLDHQRRQLIAKRLVELAVTKQVIVFTHDLLFLNFLKTSSSSASVDFQCHWIEVHSNQPGFISNNNSPATESEYKTAKHALRAWEESRKVGPEQREKILKEGFASLRTNYECLVIFDLFKAVVLRFDERVSIDRLNEVVVLPSFTNKLIQKMGTLSKYIEAHLHSDIYGSTKATSEDLKKEIDDFQSLTNELKELRKKVLEG